jgi:hypothetical protein
MIAVSFLVRVGLFLISAAIICGGIALVWFALLYFFKISIDTIERSNRDFFIWLKEKFPFKQIIERRSRKEAEKEKQRNDGSTQ